MSDHEKTACRIVRDAYDACQSPVDRITAVITAAVEAERARIVARLRRLADEELSAAIRDTVDGSMWGRGKARGISIAADAIAARREEPANG